MALNNFSTKQKTAIFILSGFILLLFGTLISCRENGPVCIAAPECRGDTAVRFAVIGDWLLDTTHFIPAGFVKTNHKICESLRDCSMKPM